ncbi:MAG TPA: hypothetical protein PJ994_07435 [Tepidiformaceae bacterium]|nr:hypothetical protein [Tepidiformaceae bacterium]HMO96699.1 hypothetical protein [Tepidiformaceae bacterium]
MTLEMVVIGLARILGSLPVLRWAFVGGIIAVLVDFSDLFMMNLLDLGGLKNYQVFDKWIDQVYMLTFLIVALRWEGPARTIAIVLYVWRLIGFGVFEVWDSRALLILFPNLFEFWFLFVASLPHWRPSFRFTRKNVLISGGILLAAKLFQEYVLHVGKWLDGFTAVEAVEAIWRFVSFW